MSIVVAFDGSVSSSQALDLALTIAQETGAQLSICSVLETVRVTDHIKIGQTPGEMLRKARFTAERTIDGALKKARASGVGATGEVLIGFPAVEIVNHAKRLAADLIVMGTRGRSALKRFLMGSAAEAVLRSAPCPVLIVRESVERVQSP